MHDENIHRLPPLESGDWRQRRRRKKIALGLTALLLLALAGMGATRYGYPTWQKYTHQLAEIPGLRDSLAGFAKRVDIAEEKLRAWAGDRDSLQERMQKLETKMSHGLQLARKQSQELIIQSQHRMQAEIDRRAEMMQARLDRLESSHESERARMARLEADVTAVRQDLSREIAAGRQDASRDLARVDQQLAGLDRQVDRGRRNVDALTWQLDRRRVDFEITKNHSRELAPGISLGVTRTDIGYRRFDGWLWLLPDRRTVWVRGQGAQQPVVFYSKQDGRPRELVITHVTKNSVVGYLLLPAQSASGAGGPLAQNTAQALTQ